MIPAENGLFNINLKSKIQSSKNYKMNFGSNIISGFITDIEAMKQVIWKILNTERYQYQIYSWNYGIELVDLFGEPVDYVCSESERRIKEALIQDNRIESIEEFEFDISTKSKIIVSFLVHTIFGDIEINKEVNF